MRPGRASACFGRRFGASQGEVGQTLFAAPEFFE